MGQYYEAFIQQGKCKVVYNHHVENPGGDIDYHGAKLLEHSYALNSYVESIAAKLYEVPTRVIWCGDYADDLDDFIKENWLFNFLC